ncbi:MAG: inositol monophosphatase family protein [Candidatus Nanopelagicaceae bacterium]
MLPRNVRENEGVEQYSKLLDLALRVSTEAGRFLSKRPANFDIESKSTVIDIATQMDREAESMIVDAILSERGDDGIIGEEGASRPSRSGFTWVIDPLDGTVNYLYDLPGWCVSVACKDPSGTVVGVVYAPTLNLDSNSEVIWSAMRGGGAFRNGRAIRVSDESEIEGALIGTGFAYSMEVRKSQVRVINDLLPRCRDIRRMGAAAVDLCHVASGALDAYFEVGLKEWDKAAGALIITEAGGVVSGGESESSRLVAANPVLHERLKEFLSDYV